MSVKCRATHAQQIDEYWWQNRNIRVKAILLHLQQQNRTTNALQHSDQNAFICALNDEVSCWPG